MNAICAIAKREIKAYFSTPLAYVILAGLMLLMSNMFFPTLGYFLQNSMGGGAMMGGPQNLSLSQNIISPFYGNLHIIFMIMVPAITMNLLSLEYRMKSFTLLQTSPVTNLQILLGKFFGAIFFLVVLFILLFLFPLLLHAMGNPDPGVTVSANLATFLMGAAFIAIGVMCSSFTESQVISFLLTSAIIFLLMIINWAAYSSNSEFAETLKSLALYEHYREMAKGTISLNSISYYVSIIVISLYFGHRSLEAKSSV